MVSWPWDVQVFPLLEGSVRANTEEQRALLDQVRKMVLNLTAISPESLHALLQGVVEELRIREQRALSVVSEIKVNN